MNNIRIDIYKQLKPPLRNKLIRLCKDNNEEWKGIGYSKSAIVFYNVMRGEIDGFITFCHTLLVVKSICKPNYFMCEARCIYYNSYELFINMIKHMEEYAISKGCYIVQYSHIDTKHLENFVSNMYDKCYCEYCDKSDDSYYKEVQNKDVARYTFTITEDITRYDDRIISHKFKIGGSNITASYTYRDNEAVNAKVYLDTDYIRNKETPIMLKSLLKYVYKKIPTVSKFILDESVPEYDCYEMCLSKLATLSYISIAYNSQSIYENQFGAVMEDEEQYRLYKDRLLFLTNPSDKPEFLSFLQITKPSNEQIEVIEDMYKATTTYRDFFNLIRHKYINRFEEILYPWMNRLMDHYLKGAFYTKWWIVDIRKWN